jgi:hypothetical protein
MHFRTGDVIGFSAGDPLGIAINISTLGWPFWPPCWRGLSHVGIVAINNFDQPILWESTTLCEKPCIICGKLHDGVQAHVLENRVNGYAGYVWHYPLRIHLDSINHRQLRSYCERTHGVGYDTGGAIDSRSLCFGWLKRRFLKEDTSRFFCSEHLAGGMGAMEIWDPPNVSEWSPNRIVRTFLSIGLLGMPGRMQ